MKYGRGTVNRVRSVMAPGNPVPGDAYAESWQDQLGWEGRERALALSCEDAARQPEVPRSGPGSAGTRGRSAVGRGSPLRWRVRRVLAPAAAMVATAAVITSVTLAGQYESGHNAGIRPTVRRAALGQGPLEPPPAFFVGRVGPGPNLPSLGVFSATTGKLVARLTPPAGLAFEATAATANSHVFVLAAVPRTSPGACVTRLYRLRLSAAGQPSVIPLAVPTVAGLLGVPSALAASADGNVIGYSTFTCPQNNDSSNVGVINLATGHVRTWALNDLVLGMSATADGRALAFTIGMGNGAPKAYILRTDAPPGPLTRRARVVLSTAAIGVGQVALNRSGSVLMACIQAARGEPQDIVRLAAYDAATGHAIGVLHSWRSVAAPCMISAVPTGGYLLLTGFQARDIAARVDLITGRVTELPGSYRQALGISW